MNTLTCGKLGNLYTILGNLSVINSALITVIII